MKRSLQHVLWLLLPLFCTPPVGLAAQEHPFVLWTGSEAAQIRRTIENEAWARRAFESLPRSGERGSEGLPQLLRYSVMGDRAAGEAEKRLLLAGADKHDYIVALRYDVLYDLLSPDEREQVERTFRSGVPRGIDSMKSRRWNRFNWLPNLAYPWYIALHLKAAVLGDRQLAQEIFEGPFGLKWYFDEYLSDLGFYNEEFGKMYNTPDGLLLWCRACERLGWHEMGFGYRGRQGATMRGHIESVLRIGMPMVDLGTSRPHWPRLSIGDAKQSSTPAYGFQHPIVPGYLADGRQAAREPTCRLGVPSTVAWFEMAHAQWPDAGFDYFLAQRRAPDEDQYDPTLYFGLDPIGPRRADPPAASSGVYPGRGLVVLRAEEGPPYWTSPGPAVGMRLATPYAHHVQDCFSLTGFYAFNRPIYINRKHASNYSGVDPGYSNSARSHSTVVVDFEEPKTIGEVPVRHEFTPEVKFAAAQARGVYDGVDQTRVLMLTRQYLLDVFRLSSDRPRHYQWIVHGLGHTCADHPRRWTPSRDLVGYLFDLDRERSWQTDETWAVSMVQSSGGANAQLSGFGPRWFQERIGSRITMLGEPGTTAYTAWGPVVEEASGQWRGRDRFAFGEDEPAAAAVVATRKCEETTFVALHEPFRTRHYIDSIRRIGEDPRAAAVRLVRRDDGGAVAFVDYLMVRLDGAWQEPITVGRPGERFTFRNYAWVRLSGARLERVERAGGLVEIQGGRPQPALPELQPGPIAARWMPESPLCLATGGAGSRALRLRNAGMTPVTARVELRASPGLKVEPPAVELKDFEPGAEQDVMVSVSAAAETANRLLRIEPTPHGGGSEVEPAVLEVAHGVLSRRSQRWPADFAETIYSPRYLAKVYYMESGAAMLLLDPEGLRRTTAANTSHPKLVRYGVDQRGREGWWSEKVPRFPYFITVLVPGEKGRPAHLYEAGEHAHGSRSAVEHWFTEDWIVVRYREAKPGERIAFDWQPRMRQTLDRAILGRRADLAAMKMPGKLLVADRQGGVHDAGAPGDWPRRASLPKDLDEIAAVFHRPDGYGYGSAMFYPAGAKLEKRSVTQPGEKPMAFTFCTEEEFPGLLERWLKDPPSGQATELEEDLYGAAFMPHLEEPQ